MKLDQIILILLAIGATIYVGSIVFGMLQIMPYGLIGLGIIAIFLGIMGRIVYDRLNNEEDDYYQKNVEK